MNMAKNIHIHPHTEETFLHLSWACKQMNEKNRKLKHNEDVIFEVLQLSEFYQQDNCINTLLEFYENWRGNVDFIHIPDLLQLLINCQDYFILIARRHGTDDLLGISTLKYYENELETSNPYFQEPVSYFEITGLLAKNKGHYAPGEYVEGIGKQLNKIAYQGTMKYIETHPNTKLTSVIDCRNMRSFNSAEHGFVTGFYELRNPDTNQPLEAPTAVIEFLPEQAEQGKLDSPYEVLDFCQQEGKSVLDSVTDEFVACMKKYGIIDHIPVLDPGCGMVHYHTIESFIPIQHLTICPNGTDLGNDRITTLSQEDEMVEEEVFQKLMLPLFQPLGGFYE